jgi:hypothetical protein
MRRAKGIDGGDAESPAMVGVDCGRSGADLQGADPVPFPERVSAIPSSGKGIGSAACNTVDMPMRVVRRPDDHG